MTPRGLQPRAPRFTVRNTAGLVHTDCETSFLALPRVCSAPSVRLYKNVENLSFCLLGLCVLRTKALPETRKKYRENKKEPSGQEALRSRLAPSATQGGVEPGFPPQPQSPWLLQGPSRAEFSRSGSKEPSFGYSAPH